MTSPDPSEPWTRFALPDQALLPPTCPSCLGPGVREIEVPPLPGPPPNTTEAPATAWYCEPCANRIESARTRQLALVLGSLVLGILSATAWVLFWGAQHLALQLGLSGGGALALPLALLAVGRWPTPGHALFRARAVPQIFLAQRSAYAQLVGTRQEPSSGPRLGLNPRLLWIPPALSIAWSLGIQFLGRAEVWIVHAEQDLTLLIDNAVVGTVPASLEEAPEAGRREVVLGGRRLLSLLTQSGEVRLETWGVLVPGRSYLLAEAPRDRCFFLIRQHYGQAAAQSSNPAESLPLTGAGPLWELPDPIDVWFAPLPPPGPLLTSGGARTALRLLPCHSKSADGPL